MHMKLVRPRNHRCPMTTRRTPAVPAFLRLAAGPSLAHACTRLGKVARVGVKPFAGIVLRGLPHPQVHRLLAGGHAHGQVLAVGAVGVLRRQGQRGSCVVGAGLVLLLCFSRVQSHGWHDLST